jgi:hypothetical protein
LDDSIGDTFVSPALAQPNVNQRAGPTVAEFPWSSRVI